MTLGAVTTKKVAVKEWKCQECGKLMNAKQAKKAMFGPGCPKCGGADIDLAPDAPVVLA